nr:immunoglobulin heavy chain junction region [Mus musculus]
CARYGYYVDYW